MNGFQHRRDFLAAAGALGAASLIGVPRIASAEPPPETTKIRLIHLPAICLAPQYLAEELLRLEGFSEVEYVKVVDRKGVEVLAAGEADVSMWDIPSALPTLDAGKPVVYIAGVHAGCLELIASDRVATIRDLKGKSVAVDAIGGTGHVFVSSLVAYVGMDPRKDIKWVVGATFSEAIQSFVEGKADAVLGFAPQPQELRLKRIGHTIINTAQDRPWSQYFCCGVAANRDYANRYPVATKRALRAILKAADLCADQPERAARMLVTRGYEPRYEIALEVLKELPYRRWRDANPEDTLRFHALRLHEVGMIRTIPEKLIAQGTNWRFLNELKKELKG
jgi:NitT/TauT family transport system substrate-binding protein